MNQIEIVAGVYSTNISLIDPTGNFSKTLTYSLKALNSATFSLISDLVSNSFIFVELLIYKYFIRKYIQVRIQKLSELAVLLQPFLEYLLLVSKRKSRELKFMVIWV